MAKPPVIDPEDDPVAVEVVRDLRLRKTIRWEWNGSKIRVRAPWRLREDLLDRQVAEIVDKVKRKRAQVRARADIDLEARARQINKRYFGGELTWHSIRWVTNMHQRLGSCTTGGPTDGDIRLSSEMKGWPDWVVDYVIAHELAHRRYLGHNPEFWALVNRYPQAERARGFVLGVAFQLGHDDEDWL
jgi:predicted metal-dependent hydrolase